MYQINTLTAMAIFRNLFVEVNYEFNRTDTDIIIIFFVRFFKINFLFMQVSIDFLFFSQKPSIDISTDILRV